jgi:hypothetical protein
MLRNSMCPDPAKMWVKPAWLDCDRSFSADPRQYADNQYTEWMLAISILKV